MSTKGEFTWDLPKNEYHPPLPKSAIGKLKAKVPMCQAVITEDNRLYEYTIYPNGAVMFQYVASIMHTEES